MNFSPAPKMCTVFLGEYYHPGTCLMLFRTLPYLVSRILYQHISPSTNIIISYTVPNMPPCWFRVRQVIQLSLEIEFSLFPVSTKIQLEYMLVTLKSRISSLPCEPFRDCLQFFCSYTAAPHLSSHIFYLKMVTPSYR